MTTTVNLNERYVAAQCPKCGRLTLTRNIGVDGRPYLRCVGMKCDYFRVEKPQPPNTMRGKGGIL